MLEKKLFTLNSEFTPPDDSTHSMTSLAVRNYLLKCEDLQLFYINKHILIYELMKKLPELLKRTGHESLKSLMLDYGFTTESEEGKVKLLSELAARWAETLVNKPKPSWWKDFLTSIQKWITKFTSKILNEKEVNELVGGFVKYGTKVNQTNTESSLQTQQEP